MDSFGFIRNLANAGGKGGSEGGLLLCRGTIKRLIGLASPGTNRTIDRDVRSKM